MAIASLIERGIRQRLEMIRGKSLETHLVLALVLEHRIIFILMVLGFWGLLDGWSGTFTSLRGGLGNLSLF